jgi:cation/acetate symporter
VGALGLVVALVLTLFSPGVWVTVLGHETALFPFTSPTIFSMPLAFFAIWLVSTLDRSGRAAVDRDGYLPQRVRAETGIGASGASAH